MLSKRGQQSAAVVLLAKDNPAEQELAQRALEDGMIYCDLRIVSDGQEALDYLHRRNGYADPKQAPRPDLILLDLNMPRVDGKDVLREVKTNSQLAAIPIIGLRPPVTTRTSCGATS